LPLGRVTKAHGIGGALEIFLYSGKTDVFSTLKAVFFEGFPEEPFRRIFKIQRVRPKKGKRAILELYGVDDRATAETFKGCKVLCLIEDLPRLAPLEYYWFEIEGFLVKDLSGRDLGRVKGVIETGAHDVFICKGASGEFLVPSVKQVVKEIRREERVLVIDPPPGLIEANVL